ncbi:hypothetical protein IPN35_03485 [Candidatus Peregrinibacteria bacterium]|nr:MAG: hypothetical protein IPN35_03485 [Candidatus Peregrinibacteria bacterium]
MPIFSEDPPLHLLFSGTLAEAVNVGVALSILVGGLLSVFFVFYGGIQFITSGGDEEKSKKAISSIRTAIIGLLVIIFSVTFVSVLSALFQFNLLPFLEWESVLHSVQNIGEKWKDIANQDQLSPDTLEPL